MQSKREKLVHAKKKKTKFKDIVEGCKKSDIKPRGNDTKTEACTKIAGAIEAKRKQ